MRKRILLAIPVLLIVGLGMLACENSTPVATEGSTIILSASPSNIVDVDPNTQEGESTIQAVILNANGLPQDGVAVFFSTNAGTLQSGGIGETTDDNGIARDILRTSQSAQVTAQSGTASTQVTVTISGQVVVDSVNLTSTSPTTGPAPLTVNFQVSVTDTNGAQVSGIVVNVTIVGDGILDTTPNGTPGGVLITDAFGIARFDVINITQDGTEIFAAAGGVSSQTITVTITPAP